MRSILFALFGIGTLGLVGCEYEERPGQRDLIIDETRPDADRLTTEDEAVPQERVEQERGVRVGEPVPTQEPVTPEEDVEQEPIAPEERVEQERGIQVEDPEAEQRLDDPERG